MTEQQPIIRCPKCGYRPKAEDRWECQPSCGTVWNTFWTRGVCPGCQHCWKETQCLECGKTSAHEAWYHWPDPQKADVEREEELEVPGEQS